MVLRPQMQVSLSDKPNVLEELLLLVSDETIPSQHLNAAILAQFLKCRTKDLRLLFRRHRLTVDLEAGCVEQQDRAHLSGHSTQRDGTKVILKHKRRLRVTERPDQLVQNALLS